MAVGTDQKLSSPSDGQSDWDSSINANNVILTRGYHTTGRAGHAVETLDVLWMNSGGFLFKYDPNSLDARPDFLAFTAAASGDSIQVLDQGVVRSFSVVPGRPYFVNPASPGRMFDTFSPSYHRVGIGVEGGGFLFDPAAPAVSVGGSFGGNGLPTGGNSGDILWKANTTTNFLSVWSPPPPAGNSIAKDAYSPPTAAAFSVVSGTNGVQPTRTDVTSTGLQIMFQGSPGPGDNLRLVMKAMATESYQIIARIHMPMQWAYRYNGFGLALVNSGGRCYTFGLHARIISAVAYPGGNVQVLQWNTHVNSFQASDRDIGLQGNPEWFKLAVNVDTISFWLGHDPNSWVHVISQARTTFQNTITHAGFFALVNRQDVISWIDTPTNHMTANVLYYSGP